MKVMKIRDCAFAAAVCLAGFGLFLTGGYFSDPPPASAQPIRPVSAEKPLVVYCLMGYNVWSYFEKEGEVFWDGTSWDRCFLVNPRVEGERVYLPAEKCHGEDGHFFYIDTLGLFTEAIYRIKSGAVCQVVDSDAVDRIDPDYQPADNGLLFGPKVDYTGANRVYIDPFDDPDPPANGRRYYRREHLELISHPLLRK